VPPHATSHEEDGRAEYCGWVRYRLASALGSLDPQTIPALIAAFRQPGPRRLYLAHAIGLFGPLATAAIPDLIAGLATYDDLRLQCAVALGEIGPAARQALPALRSLLADEGETHQGLIVREAIRKIDQQGP
jgi:HEAT repeat protein